MPYDNRNDVKMLRVRKLLGGYAGYGRWVALLGMLYDENGMLDMNDQDMRDVVAEQLELDDVDGFFSTLSRIGLIDRTLYETMSHVVNKGVADELEYRNQKKAAGKKGMESRWEKDKKKR